MSYKSANCIDGKHADCAWYGVCGDLCTCDCHKVDMEEITLERARRIRQRIGIQANQHALDCGLCASSNVFLCAEMKRLLAVKFQWMRRIQAMQQAEVR